MGTKRIGLARVEALIENLKRDLSLGDGAKINGMAIDPDVPFELLGLSKPWNGNFGADAAAGLATAQEVEGVLSIPLRVLNCSRALEGIANATDAPSAAVATKLFAGTGVAGADVAIGTTAAPGQTPLVHKKVSRLTGGVSGTVTMTAAADLAADGDHSLILFTGNTFASSGILKLATHADAELDAESSEIFVTADGTDALTRVAAPTDADQTIILTDTGDCTILAGSFLYFYKHHATDVCSVKGCIRTSGGTIAVTYAA